MPHSKDREDTSQSHGEKSPGTFADQNLRMDFLCVLYEIKLWLQDSSSKMMLSQGEDDPSYVVGILWSCLLTSFAPAEQPTFFLGVTERTEVCKSLTGELGGGGGR